MHRVVSLFLICVLGQSVCANEGINGKATTTAGPTNNGPLFETHVRSILKKHCFHCHGEEEEKGGGLDLRLVRLMRDGGDSGPAIISGKPAESALYQRVRDGEMPPDEGKLLTESEIQTIRSWIESGARTVRPEPDSVDEVSFITAEERSHWAFQPIRRPDVPLVRNQQSVINPIDAFLLSQLEKQGFAFTQQADPRTLIRRVYLDLHGLLPAPESVDAFVSEYSEPYWRRTIDGLLNSQHYGERWARHWLDIAGYADSEGYNDVDSVRPHAWRYRDYVIRSFNEDKPFDQFVTEQLAGDELIRSPIRNLSQADAELLIATGFLRMAPDGTGGSVPDKNQARNDTIADTIRVVTSAMMAMTVGCAQCHDHRYDPISQADYYQFRAIFDPALNWTKWKSPCQRLVSLYTDKDREKAAEVESKAKKIDAEHKEKQEAYINATFEKQLAKLPTEIHDLARTAHKTAAGKRTPEQTSLFKKHPNLNVTAGSLYLYDRKAADDLKAIAAKAKKLRATKPKQEFVRALTEPAGEQPVSKLFFRGDHEQPKQQVLPGGLTVISETHRQLNEIPTNTTDLSTSGRRLALAKRLTHPSHPLTARVIVNRVWRHHFGRGLVETPSDFGVLGQRPTHPELLDWLASDFVEHGWSLKRLHSLILSSNAWRQALRVDHKLISADPDNELFGGARLRRLDAEVVRDCMLAVSGKMNGKAFGPAVPVMADRAGRIVIGQENLNAGRPGAKIDLNGEEFRRSVYVQVRRSRPLSVLQTFDRPAMSPNCDMRRPSTSSTQSLLMMNSDLLLEFSRTTSARICREIPDASDINDRIQRLWKLAYSRRANGSEVTSATSFLNDQAAIFKKQKAYQPVKEKTPTRSASEEALAVLCQVLFSSNEFLYVE